MPSPQSKTRSADALVGLWTVALTAFIVAALYIARDLLIPLSLAALLTFLLAPLVSHWSGGSDEFVRCCWWSF
jgi:predicted PurR-regulated permease PerM